MIGHPFTNKPELAVQIINLKSMYAGVVSDVVSDLKESGETSPMTSRCLFNVKTHMISFLKANKDIKWCPVCNKFESNFVSWDEDNSSDPFPKCDNFGSILTFVKYGTSLEGYECKKCGYQALDRIEHWN